jgi:hypothetical protein
MKRSWFKLSHHRHTGTLRPHQHTSYLSLGILLAIVGLALGYYTASAASPGPQAGSIGIAGTVPGKPPATAATITVPRDQQHFGESPITVSGTCPAKTLVEIYKNDIFGGSTICGDDGTYSLSVDLLIGKNILIARVYDALNQAGPDGIAVTVYYDALPEQAGPLSSLNFSANQLLLNTDSVVRGVFPNQEFSMPLEVIGGAPPYAINIQWGDATNKVIPRSDNLQFNVSHTYKKAGVYQISIQATDVSGRVAFLSVAAIVNGQPETAIATTGDSSPTNKLLLLWPLYTASAAVVASFWFGEQREKHVLRARGLLTT